MNTFSEDVTKLQPVVDRLINSKEAIKVLEVGCGSCSYIHLKQQAYIVGIDISEKQLQRNEILDEKILGDAQNYNFPSEDFDLIICWWLLEHVSQPKKVIENCQKSLKENGIFIIAAPNVFSIKGLITKFTPHWFHIMVYKYIFNRKLAGVEDNPPFPTFLSFFIAPESIKKFANKNNLSIEYFSLFEDDKQNAFREKNVIIRILWGVAKTIIELLTFNQVKAQPTDYVFVLKKLI